MNLALLNPRGIAHDGRIVSAKDAVVGEIYTCPGCTNADARLVVRASNSKLRTKHFAHLAGQGTCSPETRAHKRAKRKIRRAIRRSTVKSILLVCAQGVHLLAAPNIMAIIKDARVFEERRLKCGLIPDLTVIQNSKPVLAIEIRKTHAVTDAKRTQYARARLAWIEVDADSINDDPTEWICIASSNDACSDCDQFDEEFKRACAKEEAQQRSEISRLNYSRSTVRPSR